jgi:hypothetical protein
LPNKQSLSENFTYKIFVKPWDYLKPRYKHYVLKMEFYNIAFLIQNP